MCRGSGAARDWREWSRARFISSGASRFSRAAARGVREPRGIPHRLWRVTTSRLLRRYVTLFAIVITLTFPHRYRILHNIINYSFHPSVLAQYGSVARVFLSSPARGGSSAMFSPTISSQGEHNHWITPLDSCVSSLRRGRANLLCIVPMLTDDPRRESNFITREEAMKNGIASPRARGQGGVAF